MAVQITFECGAEDRYSPVYGPYPFVQATYAEIRVGEDGEQYLAWFDDGMWVTADGQKWSDFVVGAAT